MNKVVWQSKPTYTVKKTLFGEHVYLLQGELTEILDTENILVTLNDSNNGQDIEGCREKKIYYDYLVLWTGAGFTLNAKTEDFHSITTRKQRKYYLNYYKENIEKSNSILIVGGGETAIELWAEILMKYGEGKELGIVMKDDVLLPQYGLYAQNLAKDYFTRKGVKMYNLKDVEDIKDLPEQYDFIIDCTGSKCYSSYMNNDIFADWVDDQGRIFVNNHFQVTNIHPCNKEWNKDIRVEKIFENIFWYGSAWLTRMDEIKNVAATRQLAKIVATNIERKERKEILLEHMPFAVDTIAGVYFSNWSGAFMLNDYTTSSCCVRSQKEKLQNNYMSFLKQTYFGRLNNKAYRCKANSLSWMLNNLFCWCSCNKRRRSRARRQKIREIFQSEIDNSE